jgi:hypothetical protein
MMDQREIRDNEGQVTLQSWYDNLEKAIENGDAVTADHIFTAVINSGRRDRARLAYLLAAGNYNCATIPNPYLKYCLQSGFFDAAFLTSPDFIIQIHETKTAILPAYFSSSDREWRNFTVNLESFTEAEPVIGCWIDGNGPCEAVKGLIPVKKVVVDDWKIYQLFRVERNLITDGAALFRIYQAKEFNAEIYHCLKDDNIRIIARVSC